MSDLKAELRESLDEAEWEWLIPHADRDAVIMVADSLDLVEVGYAIANDQISSVQQWIQDCLIYKPSIEQKTVWNEDQTKRFQALILQPYVLIQELAAA
ncbi:DUF2288 family protein [Cyanobacteria bacterium FACHB-DQ100]|uniref:DUF2288 domain-containing protein n=1 Tax=Leptolyngbya sp. DQ-M1 TaxID=2933920 RepID=UPI0019A18C99|nr:DUF2288 family protein [Cyanobacteria bacterium FACHB-DQ100]